MNILVEAVQQEMTRLGMESSDASAQAMATYLRLLLKWNAKINLVGVNSWPEILSRLIADSWHLGRFLFEHIQVDDPLCLDFGAGAGLPGIPLRMFWGKGRYWLVEVRVKRAMFLRQVLTEIALPNTFVFGGRAETLGMDCRSVDLGISRAFMPWKEFLGFACDYVRPDGMCVVMASQSWSKETLPGWKLVAEYGYPVEGNLRYFWGFRRAPI